MMAELLPPCPDCGSQDFVWRNCRVYGWAEEQFDEYGETYCLVTDSGVEFGHSSQTLRCGACGRTRKDLHVVNRRVVPKT